MSTLTQAQDKLIATLVKVYRTDKAKGRHILGKRSVAAKVAENKCERAVEAMGFTMLQAYRAVCDARDMAKLMVECEA